MIVIANSHSNQTNWLFVDKNQRFSIETPGLTMLLKDADQFQASLCNAFNSHRLATVSKVFLYVAETGETSLTEVLEGVLNDLFVGAEIKIENEILGAARSLLGNAKGIACILDDVANSCYYDGSGIAVMMPALGYMLGEGGSSTHIGLLFLKDYFEYAVPVDIKYSFENELALNMTTVLHSVLDGNYPEQYLIGLSDFLEKNKDHYYIRNLIKRSFSDFLVRNIEHYNGLTKLSVNFVGSMAYHFSDLLEEVANEKGIPVGKIIEKPLEGLELFHTT